MKITKMKVRELLTKELDIDVYDNVCEELGIAFCGPMALTKEGEQEFAEVMEYDVEVIEPNEAIYQYSWVGIVDVDGEEGEWQKKLKKAKKLFHGLAGYCSTEDYDRWFKEV